MQRREFMALLPLSLLACKPSESRVEDADGRPHDPFKRIGVAMVLAFVATDCPLSNRYAPELRRQCQRFAPLGVGFYLVYTKRESLEEIAAHARAFAFGFPALRDRGHQLVARAGVRVTPEVAVFVPGPRLVYRGRVDDRNERFGVVREEPTVRDLEVVLDELVAGRVPATLRITDVLGCTIPAL